MDKLKTTFNILVWSVKDFFRDNGPVWAAAVAFYSLLSFFPLLLAAVSIAAYFVDANWAVDQLVRFVGDYLPQGENTISGAVKGVMNARGTAGLASIAFLLWSGSRVFGVLVQAINQAYNVEDDYSLLKRRLVELIMLLTIGLLFIAALLSRFLIRYWLSKTDLFSNQHGILLFLLQDLVPALLLLVVFFLIFRFVPKYKISNWSAAAGALTTSVLFLAARPLFLGYFRNIANYNLIYGPLAAVVILIIWAWITAIVILYGGEVTSRVQKIVVERT